MITTKQPEYRVKPKCRSTCFIYMSCNRNIQQFKLLTWIVLSWSAIGAYIDYSQNMQRYTKTTAKQTLLLFVKEKQTRVCIFMSSLWANSHPCPFCVIITTTAYNLHRDISFLFNCEISPWSCSWSWNKSVKIPTRHSTEPTRSLS